MESEIENIEVQRQTDEKIEEVFKKANVLVTLKFEDVVYIIKIKSRGGFCFKNEKSEEKVILKGISGAASPGELMAILGPSGCGKTTLLRALGGQHRGDTTRGLITYNDKPFSAAIKRKSGFVAQADVFYPHLTVIETLVFTALLRLPNSLTTEDKILHTEAVVNELGLTKCKNTIVGGRLIKGISGGERKRVSIGQELLINPSLLFLDEPTSGLDSTTAKKIVSSLWRLAKGGRTILMTIHQPSSSLFYMFNKVLLLSEGSSLYFGKGEDTMNYFANIGFAPSVAMNPLDFLLDLANGVPYGDSKEDSEAVKKTLISAYESNLYEKLKAELQEMINYGQIDEECKKKTDKWSTTCWQQFLVLLKRNVKERRHESFSHLKIGHVLVISIVTGLIWWQSSTDNLEDQVGLLFFLNRFAGFFPLVQAISSFTRERIMLEKESYSGMYRLSSYFMARTISDLPMELALPTVFVTITYWMGGLKPRATSFFQTLLVSLYTTMVAQSLGLAIGAVVMKQKLAIRIGSDMMLIFILTGGFLVQNVPAFISWIKYLSLTYYSYKLLLLSQYKDDDTYICGSNSNVTCLVGENPRIKFVGLNQQLLCIVALGIMFVGFRVVAYVALMKVGVTHK